MKHILSSLGFLALGLGMCFVSSCQFRPVQEMALADVALRAAQKVKADALAPDEFRRAENNFLRAKKDYNEGYFDSSRKHADEARVLAEKAEYKSLLKQSQLKSKVPGDEPKSGPPGSPEESDNNE